MKYIGAKINKPRFAVFIASSISLMLLAGCAAALSGKIKERETAYNLSGIKVVIESENKVQETYSDQKGNYNFTNLKKGEYDIKIEDNQDYLPFHAVIRIQKPEKMIKDIELKPMPSIKGKVFDGAMPVNGMKVELWSIDRKNHLNSITDAKGEFQFPGLQPGDYYLEAFNKTKSCRRKVTLEYGTTVLDLFLEKPVRLEPGKVQGRESSLLGTVPHRDSN